jgi:hypothetical protein
MDGFPQVQCQECWAYGEVVLVELGLGEGSEAVKKLAVRIAA